MAVINRALLVLLVSAGYYLLGRTVLHFAVVLNPLMFFAGIGGCDGDCTPLVEPLTRPVRVLAWILGGIWLLGMIPAAAWVCRGPAAFAKRGKTT